MSVEIDNIPKNRFSIDKLKGNLMADVEATGFSLLNYEQQNINVDFRKTRKQKNNNLFYFLPNTLLKSVSKKLGKKFKVFKINPDTLYFELKEK
ncbi:MAG: hypothetical protein V1781_03980 [Bacteroidota bacterium]